MRVKHPKKYPVYFLLLEAGIRPRKARKMIERAINSKDANALECSPSIASFCIWAETPDSSAWLCASQKVGNKFYSIVTRKVETW